MKHVQVLGIVNCETVPTQNYKISTLVKRVPGDIIEARQMPVIIFILSLSLSQSLWGSRANFHQVSVTQGGGSSSKYYPREY